MNNPRWRQTAISSALAAILLLSGIHSRAQYAGTEGIFAEFNTSMGSYTCRLEYVLAPKACANFIGLATGQRAWLELPSGVVKTNPFYAGTTFHRVIAGFVIQGGSPNGQGTDGPGYAFRDEFNPSLRHDSFGTLSSANSGPDSNGAQYFVIVAPTPWLNDVHSVFGKLYGGSNVVYAINQVPTDANNKPLTNVFVQGINIRRVGPAAQGFDIRAQGLPLVTNLNLKIATVGADVSLTFSNRLYADNRLYASSDLTSWTGTELGIEITAPVAHAITRSASAASQFFQMAQVQYPASTFAPKSLFGKTLTMVYTNGIVATNVVGFDAAGGGTYTVTGFPPATVLSYDWKQLPYNGIIPLIYYSGTVLPPSKLKLHYHTASSGNLTGTAYPNYPFTFGAVPFSGTFTSTP